MIATKSKPRLRLLKLDKPQPAAKRPVQNLLLELAYNLHATRVVQVLPAESRTAIH